MRLPNSLPFSVPSFPTALRLLYYCFTTDLGFTALLLLYYRCGFQILCRSPDLSCSDDQTAHAGVSSGLIVMCLAQFDRLSP